MLLALADFDYLPDQLAQLVLRYARAFAGRSRA